MFFTEIFVFMIIALFVLLFIIIVILFAALLYLNESLNILSNKVNIYISSISKEIDTNKEDIIAYITETTNEKIAPLLKKNAHTEKKLLQLEVLCNSVEIKYDCLYNNISKREVMCATNV